MSVSATVDWSSYAGRWIALTELREVAGVGLTPAEALQAGRLARPRERLLPVWVSSWPPHLRLPAWPLELLRPWLPADRIWLVGGTVRDLWLERVPHDWDFAVDGEACALARCVADQLHGAYMTLDEEHDTGRVIVQEPLSHRPITLDFARLRGATLEEDLRLRDFTINALALTLEGRLVDATGGVRDLETRWIAVTGPQAFRDDPVRLLRAVRLAGELDFNVTGPTVALIRAQAELVTRVAGERLATELVRLLRLAPAAPWLQRAEQWGLLAWLLPEVVALRQVQQSRPHIYAEALTHTLAAVTAGERLLALVQGRQPLPAAQPAWAWEQVAQALTPFQAALGADLQTPLSAELTRADMLKWGLLFHDVGKALTRTVDAQQRTHFYGHAAAALPLVEARLTALHFPRKALEFVLTLVGQHMRLVDLQRQHPLSRRAIYRFFQQTGEAGVTLILLALADALAVWGPELDEQYWGGLVGVATTLWRAWFEQREELVMPPPLLTGKDLLALGFEAGPQLGRLLAALREAQAAGEITTREQAEAWVAQQQETR